MPRAITFRPYGALISSFPPFSSFPRKRESPKPSPRKRRVIKAL
ncbi:MAG: hypothetical protein ACR2P4_06005 [Gammaproteobacteria bacterium]